METIVLKVGCYAGYKGMERPMAVEWQGSVRPVAEILERRYEPDGAAFKVRLEGGVRLILRYNSGTDCWEGAELPRRRP